VAAAVPASRSSSTPNRRRTPPTRRQAAAARRGRRKGARPARPPRRRSRGLRIAVAAVLAALAALPFGVLAWAAEDGNDRLPAGTRIAGIDLGGLPAPIAIRRLRAQVGVPARRAAHVSIDGDTPVTLTSAQAGVHLDLRAVVHRALARGRRGSFLTRGWRELTGAKLASSTAVRVRVDRRAVQAFVDRIAEQVAVPAQAATLDVSVHAVGVTEGHDGRRLADPDGLADRLVAALREPGSARRLDARTEVVPAPATDTSLWDAHPVVVTVSHDEKLVRVFDHGKLVKSYPVAVGMPEYPTPYGTFSVQTMQKDPVWNVPDSDWAGDLAGTTVPGGSPDNPLKARFIGFDGSVGFHGTADIGSLGTAASHGCIRMHVGDVKDLFDRVSLGTTVYLG
jgi:lipoprotein-anchoring transpeptidase ErfK/SrfK